MPTPRRRSSKSAKAATALDARQLKLQQEEEALRQKRERLQKIIVENPQKAARIKEDREREVRSRARDALDRRSPRALVDKRFDVSLAGMMMPAPSRPRRAMKAQRRQTQMITLALLVVLAVLVFALWSYLHP